MDGGGNFFSAGLQHPLLLQLQLQVPQLCQHAIQLLADGGVQSGHRPRDAFPAVLIRFHLGQGAVAEKRLHMIKLIFTGA